GAARHRAPGVALASPRAVAAPVLRRRRPRREGRVKTLVAFAEVAWGYFRTRKQFLLARLAERGWRVVYLEPVAQGRGNAWAPREDGAVTIVTVPFLKTVTRQPLYNAAIEFPPARAALEGLARRAVKDALARLGIG